jgi:uncharacterized OB-fold protein
MIEVITEQGADLHVPQVDDDSREYFAALARGEFVLQWLPRSGWQHYPRPAALYTADNQPEWRPASGRGTVHTFTVVRHHGMPYFKAKIPYVVAMIELPEGVRMMGNVTGIDADEVRIGLPVELYSVRIADDIGIPFWRPAPVA